MRRISIISTGDEFCPSLRQRIRILLPLLDLPYTKIDLHFTKKWAKKPKVITRLEKYLCLLSSRNLFIHRYLPSPLLVSVLSIMKKRIIFDFDDAIFMDYNDKTGRLETIEGGRNYRKFMTILCQANLVLVSNNNLRNRFLAFNPNIQLAYNAISFPKDIHSIIAAKSLARGKDIRILWSGTASNLKYLKAYEVALARLQTHYPFELIVMAEREEQFNLLQKVTFVKWTLEKEEEMLRLADIGIAPLYNDEWTQCKSNFKALRYISYGLITICPKFNFFPEIFVDKDSIFYADSEEEFESVFGHIYKHINELDDMRHRAFAVGQAVFDEKVRAKALTAIFNEVYGE